MPRLTSFNLMGWIEDNRDLLTPPMTNKPVWRDSDFTVMILAGPILRNDFHVDPHEEFFYQLKGNMSVKVVEDGAIREVPVAEGNVMLMPARLPHSPQRPEANSIGLVVERRRTGDAIDAFEWYCGNCVTRLHRGDVRMSNFAAERDRLFDHYYGTVANGSCPTCGAPNPKRVGS